MARAAVEHVRGLAEETPIATGLLPDTFTLTELRQVYEALWGKELHAANFRQRVLSTPGFLVATGEKRSPAGGIGRVAEVYRRGDRDILHPPLRRPGSTIGREQRTSLRKLNS
jgi:8-oxo-dGTP diphosphatase